MNLSIRGKIVLISVAIMFLGIGANTVISTIVFTREHSKALQSKAFVIGQTLKFQLDSLLRLEIPIQNLVGFEEQCHELVNKYEDISYAMIVDLDGKILFHNDFTQHGQLLADPAILKEIKSEEGALQVYSKNRENFHNIIIPVFGTHGEHIGSAMIGFPTKIISQKTGRMVIYSIWVAFFFLVFGIMLLIISLNVWVAKPLGKLIDVIQDIRQKGTDFAQLVEIDSKDEIGQLGSTFNYMIIDLKESHEKIRNYTQELEVKVQERTAELKAANEQLEGDIARRKQAEEALRESEKRLRYLSSYLLTTQERERKRISLELHDELGQALTVLKLNLRSIERELRDDQTGLREDCENTLQYIDQIVENVRRLSRDLTPSIIEDLGLSAALGRLVDDFTRHSNINTSLDIADINHLFSHDSQIVIFRIFQEALTNIGKYAQATHISIVARRLEDSISFLVEDDGNGFDVKQVLASNVTEKGLGLAAMQERARMLGGSLNIWSQEKAGTRITINVPVDEEGNR